MRRLILVGVALAFLFPSMATARKPHPDPAPVRKHHKKPKPDPAPHAHASWTKDTALNAMHSFAIQQCDNGPAPWGCTHVNNPAGCNGPYGDPQWKCWNRADQGKLVGDTQYNRCLYVWENYSAYGDVTGWGEKVLHSGVC